MLVNIAYWLRAFRTPLQRAFAQRDETARLDDTGRDLVDLLRRADERLNASGPRTGTPDGAQAK